MCVILDAYNNNKPYALQYHGQAAGKPCRPDPRREVTSPGVRTIGARCTLNGDSRVATNLTVNTSSVNITVKS